jgi:hypothetical protein
VAPCLILYIPAKHIGVAVHSLILGDIIGRSGRFSLIWLSPRVLGDNYFR